MGAGLRGRNPKMENLRNDFSRFETALRCREPDRVPIAEITIDGMIKEAVLGRNIETLKDEVDFWHQTGYDYIPFELPIDFKLDKISTEDEKSGKATTWLQEGYGPIQNWEDFENHPWPDSHTIELDFLDETAKLLPERMKTVIIGGGFLSRSTYLMGFESFCYNIVDQPELVASLFKKVGNIVLETMRRAVLKPKVGGIWITCDMAYTEGLLVSKKILKKHVFPWIEEAAGLCGEHRIPCIFHSDGKLWDIIDDLVAAGINGLHPIEPKAMDIEEVKKRYRGKLCLLGNVDLDAVLTRGTPEIVANEVKRKISTLGQGGGYCLGSSNSIPDYVPVENYVAMVKTALDLQNK